MRIFFGLIGIIIGTFIVWKTYPLVNFFGRIDWAERHLAGGFGGTYFLYKIVGIVFVVLGAMYMFGLLDVFMSPFRSIFGGLQ
ncbi:hypothetical protein D4R52_01475 [bacterium]|nr:MAG: hypothetical protein D4R52_01475 [bacterium]